MILLRIELGFLPKWLCWSIAKSMANLPIIILNCTNVNLVMTNNIAKLSESKMCKVRGKDASLQSESKMWVLLVMHLSKIRCKVSPFKFSHVVDHIGWPVMLFDDLSRIWGVFEIIYWLLADLLNFDWVFNYFLTSGRFAKLCVKQVYI